MLLYAIYAPSARFNDSWNRERVYAFASVERFVEAFREVNNSATGSLEMVTKNEARAKSGFAALYSGVNNNGIPKQDGELVSIFYDGLKGHWDSSVIEIHLTHFMKDEKIPKRVYYS